MIGNLFRSLLGNCGNPLVRGFYQPAQLDRMPGVEQELAHQGAAEVAVGHLAQEHVAEIPYVAQEGEVVSGSAFALHFTGKAKPHLGLADQVQRGVGQRDVLFQHRCVAAPFADPVAEDQSVVPHPQQELAKRVFLVNRGRHYIAPTSSGMSKKVGWR